ncbi:MAG TPA: TIGR02281 family clan AA aspartic protease [Caulobacteraceae bacterium]
MMRFAIIAMVAAVFAVGVAQGVSRFDPARRPPAAGEVAVALPAAQADSGPASIAKSPDGHYWAEADVDDGHAVRFLVDTGATAVALTRDDAQRLGIDTASLTYSYPVATANGEAHAAPVTLSSVSVAGARVSDVQAYVLDQGLETSLLGMTYLGRLSAIEATPTSMILRP